MMVIQWTWVLFWTLSNILGFSKLCFKNLISFHNQVWRFCRIGLHTESYYNAYRKRLGVTFPNCCHPSRAVFRSSICRRLQYVAPIHSVHQDVWYPPTFRKKCLPNCPSHATTSNTSTVGSRFATVHFMTIHFYGHCRVGPSTPDLWCNTVATQVSFL
jgi:hypothetical protein